MKKWVFGCLGLFIVVAGVGAFLAYKFVYQPLRDYARSYTQLVTEVPKLNEQIENRAPFTPPATNVLSKTSVDRFVQAQQTIHAQMGARLQELEAKYKDLDERFRNSGERPSFGEGVAALKDLMGLFVDAKEAQVAALNAQGFSLAEYEWTRSRVYEALGLPIDTTVQQLIREASAGKMPDFKAISEKSEAEPVPERNRELVQPHAQQLTEGAALAFFAL
jgi:hypothetical protein